MTASQTPIEIRLSGEGIAPSTIRSRDTAELIASIEEMIASELLDPDSPDTERVTVGLVGVRSGSATLQFQSPDQVRVRKAFLNIAAALSKGQFSRLRPKTLEYIQNFQTTTKRLHCVAEFRKSPKSVKPLAILRPETHIADPSEFYVSGETTLYGRLLRVGGAVPKAVLKLDSRSKALICDISTNLAKELGRRLYTWVGVSGIAKWDPRDYSVREFKIQAILPYEDVPVLEAFRKLSDVAGKHFDGVDPVAYVEELRGD